MSNLVERLEEIKEKATKRAEKQGWELKYCRYLSKNPNSDDFLFVVLCEKVKNMKEFVVWLYNSQGNAFYEGQYSTSHDMALQNYYKKK